ncbi:MAG: HDOD domain-containing protein [Spirochaetaceae bacterium]|jgi:hypothetical protein|nr:HDOD domain-containing protein [Spirochaetaceae bacterium]
MSIDRSKEQEILNIIRAAPAFPQSRACALRICNSSIAEPLGLYKLITMDPVLYFQTRALFHEYFPPKKGEYSSIAKIIIILNINTVKNHILPFVERAPVKKDGETGLVFLHSIACAVAARAIAGLCGVCRADYEPHYAAALLDNIGKYVRVKGVSGGALAPFIAKTAGLDTKREDLLNTTALASYIVHSGLPSKYGGDKNVRLPERAAKKLGADEELLSKAARQTRAEIKKCEAFIKAGA